MHTDHDHDQLIYHLIMLWKTLETLKFLGQTFKKRDAVVIYLIGIQFWGSINSKMVWNTFQEDWFI